MGRYEGDHLVQNRVVGVRDREPLFVCDSGERPLHERVQGRQECGHHDCARQDRTRVPPTPDSAESMDRREDEEDRYEPARVLVPE